MNFAEYLVSKKIDEALFKEKESTLWIIWNQEFETMHPASFTAQKLYLINPIRRKYPLKVEVESAAGSISNLETPIAVVNKPAKPAMSKPAMPKPTMAKPVVQPQQNPAGNETDVNASAPASEQSTPPVAQPAAKPVMSKPAIPRPVMKPKPKTDE